MTSPFLDLLAPGATLRTVKCHPSELYANALSIATHGDGSVDRSYYWLACTLLTDTMRDQALDVVRSAATGEMPSWFADTYDDANGAPDLERVWVNVKAIRDNTDKIAAVFQLRNAFGGYCDNQKAAESALRSGGSRAIPGATAVACLRRRGTCRPLQLEAGS